MNLKLRTPIRAWLDKHEFALFLLAGIVTVIIAFYVVVASRQATVVKSPIEVNEVRLTDGTRCAVFVHRYYSGIATYCAPPAKES